MSNETGASESETNSKRVNELKQRLNKLNNEAKQLKEYQQKKLQYEEIESEQKLKEMDYDLKRCEEYTPIGQLNSMYSRFYKVHCVQNKRTLYCRCFTVTDGEQNSFITYLIEKSLKIWKYVSQNESLAVYIVRLVDIFKVNTNLYVLQKRFDITCSLAHRLWNFDEITVPIVKEWIVQLTDATEMLNITGVAHRFIRCENILITLENRIKLTCFDMACFFWDPDENKIILQSKELPGGFDRTLLDHLPPECFAEQYDPSDVDVWSIGALMCVLLTRNNPFNIDEPNLIAQWKACWERRTLPEEIRCALDDIFKPENKRMMLCDLKTDKRLSQSVSKPINYSQYHRIDLIKDINVKTNEDRKKNSHMPRYLSHPDFNNKSREIYELQCFKTEPKEEALYEIGYSILRNKSFSDEFSIFFKDSYLKAMYNNNVCLLKIFILSDIPLRHRNMLLNESVKIMRYFSLNETVTTNRIHKITDTFVIENKLYIFYESLFNSKTIYQICNEEKCVSNLVIKKWILQLSEIIDYLTYYAISHRYIRPEYVFIENENIKLTHFDMACFVCNPIENIQVARHRGLQDELEFQWNHLPPECFEIKYDSLVVDVWSLGVLLTFCLTLDNPFKVPFEMEEAEKMWSTFKTKTRSKLANFEDLLNLIFVNSDSRIRSANLVKKINSIELRSKSDVFSKIESKVRNASTLTRFSSDNGRRNRNESNRKVESGIASSLSSRDKKKTSKGTVVNNKSRLNKSKTKSSANI